jgi:hypothetical protein
MALLFYDGFEGLAAVAANNAGSTIQLRYASVGGAGNARVSNTNTPPPDGGYYWEAGNPFSTVSLAVNVSPHASGVVGMRFRGGRAGGFLVNLADAWTFRLVEINGSIAHLTLRVLSSGAVEVRRGLQSGTVLGTSDTAVFSVGVWAYLEMKYIIDDTNGGVWVKVNGADVLRLGAYAISPTTLDTRNAGTAGIIDQWQIGNPASTDTFNPAYGFDDLYMLDLTGVEPYNDFLGSVRVLELTPDAAGASAQFTPSAGTNHEAVDEVPGHDGNTTYVESGTAGHRDLYNLTTATVSSVLAVKTIAVARRTDAGPTELELSVRSGSTTGDSTPKLLADTFGEHAHTFLINPDTTNPWQPGELAGLQAGIKVPT